MKLALVSFGFVFSEGGVLVHEHFGSLDDRYGCVGTGDDLVGLGVALGLFLGGVERGVVCVGESDGLFELVVEFPVELLGGFEFARLGK